MARVIRISLLGLGRAGRFHLQSLKQIDGAKLEMVYDVDTERAQQVAAQHQCRVAGDSVEATSSGDIDAVIVATPTDSHFQFVIDSLKAGKCVLTEKPLGSKLRHIDDSFQLAERQSLPLFVAFQRRFDPSFASLIAGVHDGQIGQLKFVRSVSRDNPVPSSDYIRDSGGIYHDCVVHDLDMVCHLVGKSPEHIAAFGSSFIPAVGVHGDHDNVVSTLSFAGGVIATIDVNRHSAYGYDQRIEVLGEDGMLQAENRHQTTTVRADAGGFTRSPAEYSFPTRYRDAYAAELQCFVEVCRGDQQVPISHQDVRDNHLLASGMELAARELRVVRFDEIEDHLSDE